MGQKGRERERGEEKKKVRKHQTMVSWMSWVAAVRGVRTHVRLSYNRSEQL